MSKLLIVCAILCTTVLRESHAEFHTKELTAERAFTFSRNIDVYTVWKSKNFLHLNSTDKHVKKPCAMAIDPVKDAMAEIIGKIQVTPSISHSSFLVYGIRSLSSNNARLKIDYTFLLVDPYLCSYKSVSVPTEEIPASWNYLYPQVVAVADTFDIFFPSRQKCSPCRFNAKGEQIKLEHQLARDVEDELDVVPYGSKVLPIHPIEFSEGYFYANNFKNNTAVMRHLDRDFKTVKQVYVQHPVHSVSIWSGKQPMISICYSSHNYNPSLAGKHVSVNCEELDIELKSKLTIHLPIPNDHYVFGMRHLTHQIDGLGNLFVGLLEAEFNQNRENTNTALQLRFFLYKADKLVESHNLYTIGAEKNNNSMLKLHSFYLIRNEFCLVTDNVIDENTMLTREVFSCFDVTDYYKRMSSK